MKAKYLICYDIRDEKRLNKIYKFLRGSSLHIQYSVFYGILDWDELNVIKSKLKELIDEYEDDIRIYPLPSEPKVIVMGQGDRIPEGVNVFLK
ncbi:MAG: CRISPR-associated endonuclease Cas2 [Proteobacteria bacterium]|nr:CRISPR-associated endonuclease Cas2 [Pseudomonadota bacterium]